VPKYLELVASLPKTSSGKVRRAELINMGAPKHEA
jgi:acyl-coenzyme A synthetase/AMP-(fatty) acid ligase